ncbi:HD domain-containing protein [Gudongella sp. SC589]|jgi:HD superfamily phosphodiesterase|uniref:HD domain-containing protein n=1 Tax=Gudongella sp. SC589 TaxID=3385990 RepID=UPI0039046886
MDKKDRLIHMMIEHDSGDPWMIQHFLKVHELSRIIGMMEGLSEEEMEILEAASMVHDIGIKVSREKYGESSGKLQEKEGPPYARRFLERLEYKENVIDRVCYLVAHHHTYDEIDGRDYQILVEADFLVNLYEKSKGKGAIEKVYEEIFRTESGKKLCRQMFGI